MHFAAEPLVCLPQALAHLEQGRPILGLFKEQVDSGSRYPNSQTAGFKSAGAAFAGLQHLFDGAGQDPLVFQENVCGKSPKLSRSRRAINSSGGPTVSPADSRATTPINWRPSSRLAPKIRKSACSAPVTQGATPVRE